MTFCTYRSFVHGLASELSKVFSPPNTQVLCHICKRHVGSAGDCNYHYDNLSECKGFDINDDDNETFEGAIKRPTIQVNKTRDITLGFIKLKNDCKLKAKLILEFPDFEIIWLNLFYFR